MPDKAPRGTPQRFTCLLSTVQAMGIGLAQEVLAGMSVVAGVKVTTANRKRKAVALLTQMAICIHEVFLLICNNRVGGKRRRWKGRRLG